MTVAILIVLAIAFVVAKWPDSPLVVWPGVTVMTVIALALALVASALIAMLVTGLLGTS